MKHVVVTGGCGFIGSNFVRQQLAEYPDRQIINLDLLTYAGNPLNLKDVADSPRYSFHRVDICDRPAVDAVLEDLPGDETAVVHFAAESHVDRSIADSGPFIRTNIVGTQVLLDACRHSGVSRFVQVSTDEVYGSLGDEGWFVEDTPLDPSSPYSASKAAADMLVQSYCRTFDFPGMITRCSNNYGPYQFPEKLIPLFISRALDHERLPVYGTGKNVRDWIHVTDHCRGIDAVLASGQPGRVYNFGGAAEVQNLELTKLLLQLLDRPESLIQFVADRPGHDHRYAIDFSRARTELDWSPQVTFEQGLRETIDWYRSHQDWIDGIRSGEYRNWIDRQYGERLEPDTAS
ncbi:MAG: dTDP-glucose 4,6-dehydratase [Planctomycetaceae bacterium]|nr:dTDP-glucose 4,6-dehydratase [Planctomycetaceae bacterium]